MRELVNSLCELDQTGIKHQVNHIEKLFRITVL